MNAGIWVSNAAFQKLSASAQKELLAHLIGSTSMPPIGQPPADSNPPFDDEEGPVDLSPAQARRLANGLGNRARTCLRAVAEQHGRFLMSQIRDALGDEDYGRLSWVWGAITKRVRNVLGDSEAEFFWWGDGIYSPDGEWLDHQGWVSPTTCRSLRAYFGMR